MVSAALAVAGCSGIAPSTPARTSAPAAGGVSLNAVGAADVVRAFVAAGLPAGNPRDESDRDCPAIGCSSAFITDAVSVYKFPNTGSAERYAGGVPAMFQIEDIVLVFPAGVTDDRKTAYEDIAKDVVE